MNEVITVIPQKDYGLIVSISNKINIIAKINIPYKSISKIMQDTTIVTLDKQNKKIILHNYDGKYLETICIPLKTCLSMNIKNRVVYIGGTSKDNEACFMIDFSTKYHQPIKIELPGVMVYGKGVDDILILENKMLLIDNIVFPKFTFEYDISIENKPILKKTIRLPHGKAYENIKKGALSQNWMIYLSRSSGMSRMGSYITIEGSNNIELRVRINRGSLDGVLEEAHFYKDIYLLKDRLYVLTNIGLGYYNLGKVDINYKDITYLEHKTIADIIIGADNEALILVSENSYELIDLKLVDELAISEEELFLRKQNYLNGIDISHLEYEAISDDILAFSGGYWMSINKKSHKEWNSESVKESIELDEGLFRRKKDFLYDKYHHKEYKLTNNIPKRRISKRITPPKKITMLKKIEKYFLELIRYFK